MDNIISVIIPARNEEKTILQIINLLKKRNKFIDEIIIVDNASTDNTYKIAKKSGVKTIKCDHVGKGYAMEMGIKVAKGNILVFLDADINNYSENLVQTLIEPLIQKKADFVKSKFERTGGRVTELVAKPLLEILYPDMYKYSQPLSGMIAGKREVFENIELEKDYGVDIGILLDVTKMGAKIEEVHIGIINNNSQSWINLEKMAREVTKAIIKRAKEKDILWNIHILLY